MNHLAKMAVIVIFVLACSACSNHASAPASETPVPASTATALRRAAPAASAIPMRAPAGGISTAAPLSAPAGAPSLDVILRRPTFAKAFATMQGAASLPEWVRSNASAPSARVHVDGKTMWLSQVCQSADCGGSQAFVLTDPAAHTMAGLLVQASGSEDASVHRLTWLGKPDAAAQALLKSRMAAE